MSKRRFIAGAVCPQCRALDRVVIISEAGEDGAEEQIQRCVECGYETQLEQTLSSGALIPKGKPERSVRASEVPAQNLTILPSKKQPKSTDESI